MNIKSFLSFSVTLCLFSSSIALADWTASFSPPKTAQSSMRIDLPDDMDILTLTTLGAELDGIDITALLSLDETDFIYQPVEALSEGKHILRLVVFNNDGSISERASWPFDIKASVAKILHEPSASQISNAERWLKSASFRASSLTEASYRVADKDIGKAPNHAILSGSGDLQGDAMGENWSMKAHSNYLVQSDHDLALTGNTLDIGEYDIKADYTGDAFKSGATLGHHDLGLDSNLFSNFYRRGTSVRLSTLDDRLQARGFSFNTQSQTGANNFTGLNNHEERLEGVTTSFKPFSNDQDALQVTGIYYDGEGADGGTGISGSDITSTGSGWGMVLAKGFYQQRVKLRAEYANARFDGDGSSNDEKEDRSEAVSFSLEARPFDGLLLMDQHADIMFGASYNKIDTFFESLANPGLSPDRDVIQAYSNLYWGALSSSLQFLYETNNVDDLEGIPTNRMRSFSLNSTYSFNQQKGRLSWLGAPYLGFTGFIAEVDREDTPENYEGLDTDNSSDSITLSGGSNYRNMYWSTAYTLSKFNDDANNSIDTLNSLVSFNTGWSSSSRLRINGGLQFGTFRDRDNADNTYDTNFNLQVASEMVPNKLNINVDYNLNLANGSSDSPDRHIIGGEVEYTLFQPQRNRPGLALAVRGTLENTDGDTNNLQEDGTQYQIFTVLRVKAPLSFGY